MSTWLMKYCVILEHVTVTSLPLDELPSVRYEPSVVNSPWHFTVIFAVESELLLCINSSTFLLLDVKQSSNQMKLNFKSGVFLTCFLFWNKHALFIQQHQQSQFTTLQRNQSTPKISMTLLHMYETFMIKILKTNFAVLIRLSSLKMTFGKVFELCWPRQKRLHFWMENSSERYLNYISRWMSA